MKRLFSVLLTVLVVFGIVSCASNAQKDEEEKQECLRDYLTAYTVISFYEGEEEAKELKKYIKEKYGWQFID